MPISGKHFTHTVKVDFIARLHIALIECAESEYWLELLLEGGYTKIKVVLDHCLEVKKILKDILCIDIS